MRTHYEILGVSRDASTEQLRRAHRELARRFHPDHLGVDGADATTRNEAERRIREVNEAWRVLGDPHRRERYDLSLPDPDGVATSDASWSPFPPGVEPEPPGGFDEWYADAAHRRQQARVVQRSRRAARPYRIRFLFFFGALIFVGILLIVLITGPSEGPTGPDIGSRSCVRVEAGPRSVVVPCSEPNDGQVVGQVDRAEECPAGSRAERLTPGQISWTCLAPS